MRSVTIAMLAASMLLGLNVGATPLQVVDATGKVVGRYDGGNGAEGVVFLKINGVLTNFRTAPLSDAAGATSSGGLVFVRDELRFTTTDCTGSPYIAPRQGGVRSAAILIGSGQSLVYLAAANVPVVTITSQSVYYSDSANGPFKCSSMAGDFYRAVPVPSPLINITGRYAEPFSIR